ncbi:IS30 family transposase [Corynebacterium casei]|uniref:IS30 family transposase n=3 Tax=Corynebacterium casei TaxID=160386 RepID=UPI00046D0969|nr:IS30 family transposase [Corynebacterium casei]
MAKIGRPGLADIERRRVWDLWKQGQSFTKISEFLGVAPGSVFSILRTRGGIWFPKPTSAPRALGLAEREAISRGLAAGRSIRAIASELGRAPSTISREISKNKGRTHYRGIDAHERACRKRARPQRLKLQKNPVLTNYITARLQQLWSPEQIAGRLRLDYPNNSRMQISHEAIYRTVYLHKVRKILPHNIHHCLRRNRSIRHGRSYSTRGQWRSKIKNARSIHDRPQEANNRTVSGHREGDLIIGGTHSQIATLVDRATRKVDLVQLKDRSATHLTAALTHYLSNRVIDDLKTLTWDRGMELADHHNLTRATGIDVFFADPHSPWQRGTNENTNGLIRQYLPKKTDLSTFSQADLDRIAGQLNNRPRKCLGYKTPLEVEQSSVALTI